MEQFRSNLRSAGGLTVFKKNLLLDHLKIMFLIATAAQELNTSQEYAWV